MNGLYAVGAAISCALLVYLIITLLKPEKF
jgi:K+-transporting ATPase KdpF subunit